MEVKGQGWFCIDCEEDLFVEEGSLICTGIHQLGKYQGEAKDLVGLVKCRSPELSLGQP